MLSCSVVSDSLRPYGLQHTKLPSPSLAPGVCSNSCLLGWWCHPTNSSCVVPFSSCSQSFPASGSFPVSQLFTSGGQSIGASASSLSNEYSGSVSFRIDWFDLLAVQGALKSLLQNYSSPSVLQCSIFFMVHLTSIHDDCKNHSFEYVDLCWQSDVFAFYYAVQVCHSFSSKEQASFNFMATVTVHSDFGAQENKSLLLFPLFPHLFTMKWWDWKQRK